MQYCDTLLHAAHIVTCDAHNSIFADAALAISGGLIVDMGASLALEQRWQAGKTLRMGHAALLPGLINAHTHAAMTILRGLADDMPLMDWLNNCVFPVEKNLTADLTRMGALLGYAEMLRTGTPACVDMYLFAEASLEAAATAGLRCLCGEVVFDFPGAACANPEQALEKTRALAEKYQGHARLRVAVSPHSVYTCSPQTLRACRDLACDLKLPLHIHLAETVQETAICLNEHKMRPIAFCHSLKLLDAPCTLAHVVDALPEELDTLAATHAVVAHNPSSNMKLASGAAPVAAMLERGIPVALGTDGAASNNRLNMFTEMDRCALLHKLIHKDPAVLPAQQALHMATSGGAAAMHDKRLGQLAIGSPADCVALDLDAAGLQPVYNLVSHLVYAATGLETRMTMVNGEVLYQDGRFTRFDYPALCEEARAARNFVLKTIGRQRA